MKYPDKETYRKLYAKYLSENGRHVDELLDLAGDLTGKRVIDLCGGAGELALGAKQRGASEVVLVDECSEMADWSELKDGGVMPFSSSVEFVLDNVDEGRIDVFFCRQAVNYWLDGCSAGRLARALSDGGLFIFNTFNKMPTMKPVVKEYGFQGVAYVEVATLDEDGYVHHVQIREGMEPHVTKFKWISTELFAHILTPLFAVDIRTDGATDLYICKKI